MNPSVMTIKIICFTCLFTVLYSCKKKSMSPVNVPAVSLPSEGMIAYYPFNINANDSTTNGNHGILKDDALIISTGKIKGALKLDGNGDYVSVNTGFRLSNEFTVSCWINPEVVTRSDAAIFAKYQTNNYGPYDFYLLYDKLAFWISDGRGSFKIIKSNTAIAAKTWTYVTWTAKSNTLNIYINGVMESEISSVIPNMTTNNDLVTIGRQAHLFTQSGDLEFKGMIDELRVYQRALNPDEINLLFRQIP